MPGGQWNPANPPKRPGAYTNFVAQATARIIAPLSGIVALPIVTDWGPEAEVVPSNSVGEFKSIFGDSTDTAGYRAVYQAFKGEGVAGRGGAAQLLVLRMIGSAGKQALVKLEDTEAGETFTVKAKYKGSKGNDLSVAVEVNALDEAKQDFIVYLEGSEVERWTFAKAEPSVLAEKLEGSDWVEIEVTAEKELEVAETTSLTEGNDGSELEKEDWTNALALIAVKRFSVFVPYDLSDEEVRTEIDTWQAGLNEKGKRFTTVFGGEEAGGAEGLEEAEERSEALDDENVVNCGAFRVKDSQIVNASNEPIELNASQFAPRVAGVIAATGGTAAVTFSRFIDVTLVSGISEDSDFVSASEAGLLTLAEDSNELAPVRIEQDVTTYSSDTTAKPKELFGKLKFVRTMQKLEMRFTEFAENEDIIGTLGVSPESREHLIGQYRKILREEFETPGEIQPEAKVYVSQDPPPKETDNFIHTVYEIVFGRDIAQARGTVVVQ